MAILIGGGTNALWAWNQADDNGADRILALEKQLGRVSSYIPDTGVVLENKNGAEISQIDVGVNVFADGQTYGTNRLTSVSNPFTRGMVGLPITISGYGQRVIESFTAAGDITFSGSTIPTGTGRRFTQPLGISGFTDGVISSGNTLQSASSPFYAELVGRNVNIVNVGTREITAYTSASEVDFGGASVGDNTGVNFSIPIFIESREHSLESAGGQIIDSHRVPASNAATVVRWRIGERVKRGAERIVV